jgi:hypothetical protein
MTKRERAIKERFWLKIRKFAVTNSLVAKLEVSGLSLEEQEWCCFIINLVVVGTRKNHQAQIHSTTFKDRIGAGYARYVELLKEWKQLDGTLPFKMPCGGEAGEARKYWIPLAARQSGIVIKDFKVGRIKATMDDSKWEPHEPWIGYIRECMGKISVAKQLVNIESPAEESLSHEYAKRVFHEDFACRRGKQSQRLYHSIVEMTKTGRANLIWKATGKPLDGEYDVQSCHPVLLLTLASDANEAALYRKVLDFDIYDFIRISQKIKDTRQGCKDEWMDFVNHPSTKESSFNSNYVYQFYRKNFPQLASVIVKRSDMALHLQNLEASIMVDAVGQFCMNQSIWYVPMHDGFLCQHQDLTVVKEFVRYQFKSLTSYDITISFKSFSPINIMTSSPSIHHMLEYKAPREDNLRWNQACEQYHQLYTQADLEAEYKKRQDAKQRGKQWKIIQNCDAAKWNGLGTKFEALMN